MRIIKPKIHANHARERSRTKTTPNRTFHEHSYNIIFMFPINVVHCAESMTRANSKCHWVLFFFSRQVISSTSHNFQSSYIVVEYARRAIDEKAIRIVIEIQYGSRFAHNCYVCYVVMRGAAEANRVCGCDFQLSSWGRMARTTITYWIKLYLMMLFGKCMWHGWNYLIWKSFYICWCIY